MDITLRNPLNVPITLTELTLVLENDILEGSSTDIDVETIDDIYLNAQEVRTVSAIQVTFTICVITIIAHIL